MQLQQLVTYAQRQWIDIENATTFTDSSDTSDRCKVCLFQPRAGVALVPCEHSRFCIRCEYIIASMDSGCLATSHYLTACTLYTQYRSYRNLHSCTTGSSVEMDVLSVYSGTTSSHAA